MPRLLLAPLCAALMLSLPVHALAQSACAALTGCPAKDKTNTFSAYQIIGLNPHGVVSPRSNPGLQIVTTGVGPDVENTPIDAFSYDGYSNIVVERYDLRPGGGFRALGAGEQVGGLYGAAFTGAGDPTDAGVGFFTTEPQSPTHNGMQLVLKYKANGTTGLQVGLAVSPHGRGGVTIGDDHMFGGIADLGPGALHSGDSIATGNHFRSTGKAPTLAACGAAPTLKGTDAAGFATTGGAVPACTIRFAKPYAAAPICMVQTFAKAAPVTFVTAFTPTSLTVGWNTAFKGGFFYTCQDPA